MTTEKLPLKLCRYSHQCKHFQDSSYTCWHEEESKRYCGLYGTKRMFIKKWDL